MAHCKPGRTPWPPSDCFHCCSPQVRLPVSVVRSIAYVYISNFLCSKTMHTHLLQHSRTILFSCALLYLSLSHSHTCPSSSHMTRRIETRSFRHRDKRQGVQEANGVRFNALLSVSPARAPQRLRALHRAAAAVLRPRHDAPDTSPLNLILCLASV